MRMIRNTIPPGSNLEMSLKTVMKVQSNRNQLTLYPSSGRKISGRSFGKGNAVWQETSAGSLILDPTSGLLVTAMRLWRDGRRNWHLISREFRATLGGEKGTWALGHFEEMMGAIAVHSLRPLNIGGPGKVALTPDELMILRALAAVQRDEFDIFATAHWKVCLTRPTVWNRQWIWLPWRA